MMTLRRFLPSIALVTCCLAREYGPPLAAPSITAHNKSNAAVSRIHSGRGLQDLSDLPPPSPSPPSPPSPSLSPPSPSPPSGFLTLQYEAYSRADSDGWYGNCAAAFHAGDLDTEHRWTKLAWLNEDLLQIDASDTTYATVVAGSGTFARFDRGWGSDTLVASATDCARTFPSAQGEGVIDLRGTPYVIAGVNDTPCSKTCSGHCTTDASDFRVYPASDASASVCFQWMAHGYRARVSVTCSDGNQRCVIRCGGDSGECRPIGNMLQLALKP